MFINTIDCHDWPEYETTSSQDQVGHLRPAILKIRQQLEELDPTPPHLAETGSDELKDIKWFLQLVIKMFDDHQEYWSEEYLREVSAE